MPASDVWESCPSGFRIAPTSDSALLPDKEEIAELATHGYDFYNFGSIPDCKMQDREYHIGGPFAIGEYLTRAVFSGSIYAMPYEELINQQEPDLPAASGDASGSRIKHSSRDTPSRAASGAEMTHYHPDCLYSDLYYALTSTEAGPMASLHSFKNAVFELGYYQWPSDVLVVGTRTHKGDRLAPDVYCLRRSKGEHLPPAVITPTPCGARYECHKVPDGGLVLDSTRSYPFFRKANSAWGTVSYLEGSKEAAKCLLDMIRDKSGDQNGRQEACPESQPSKDSLEWVSLGPPYRLSPNIAGTAGSRRCVSGEPSRGRNHSAETAVSASDRLDMMRNYLFWSYHTRGYAPEHAIDVIVEAELDRDEFELGELVSASGKTSDADSVEKSLWL